MTNRVRAISLPDAFRKKQKRKARQNHSWLKSQVLGKKKWTTFSYPLPRVKYCYNLRTEVFDKVIAEYRRGKTSTSTGESVPPRNSSHLRQDILASILILGFGLSKEDFILAKRLATSRNVQRASGNSASENMKWPARPDIFEKCPVPPPNAASDDEIAEYFLNEKYALSSSDGENSQFELDDPPSKENQVDVGFQPEADSSGDEAAYDDFCSFNVNPGTVDLLRHLYRTWDNRGAVEDTKKRYGIARTKAYEIRRAIQSLRSGKIEGITAEEFEETFVCQDLMNMEMRKCKEDTIKHIIYLWNSNDSFKNLSGNIVEGGAYLIDA